MCVDSICYASPDLQSWVHLIGRHNHSIVVVVQHAQLTFNTQLNATLHPARTRPALCDGVKPLQVAATPSQPLATTMGQPLSLHPGLALLVDGGDVARAPTLERDVLRNAAARLVMPFVVDAKVRRASFFVCPWRSASESEPGLKPPRPTMARSSSPSQPQHC